MLDHSDNPDQIRILVKWSKVLGCYVLIALADGHHYEVHFAARQINTLAGIIGRWAAIRSLPLSWNQATRMIAQARATVAMDACLIDPKKPR